MKQISKENFNWHIGCVIGLFMGYASAKGVTPSGFDEIIAGMQNSFSTGTLIEEINSDQIKYEDKFLELTEELSREGIRYINRFFRYKKLFPKQ